MWAQQVVDVVVGELLAVAVAADFDFGAGKLAIIGLNLKHLLEAFTNLGLS